MEGMKIEFVDKEETMQNIKVLYEDNHIIVVVKPNNVPSQGDKTGDVDMLTMVKQYIKEKYHKPGDVYVGLVHRLDRPTRRSHGVCEDVQSGGTLE